MGAVIMARYSIHSRVSCGSFGWGVVAQAARMVAAKVVRASVLAGDFSVTIGGRTGSVTKYAPSPLHGNGDEIMWFKTFRRTRFQPS